MTMLSGRPVPGRAMAIAGALVVGGVATSALLAPLLAPYDPAAQLVATPLQSPGPDHLLGTDRYGRDVLSRVLWGGRETLLLTGGVLLLSVLGGTLLGALAALLPTLPDRVVRRALDVVVAFPLIVVALAWVGFAGPSSTSVVTALVITLWAPFARQSRSLVRAALASPSARATALLGSGRSRLLWREVLPRLRGPVLVLAALEAGQVITLVAGLGFLGLGAQPPSAEWGAMLQDGRSAIRTAPHMVAAPGLAVLLVVLGLTLVAEGLRDVGAQEVTRVGQ